MKHYAKAIRLALFAIIFNTFLLKAQDTYNPWLIGIGVNAVNNPVTGFEGDEGTLEVWNQDPAALRLIAGRYIKKGFVFQTDITLNTVTLTDPLPEQDDKLPYISFDGYFKYSLNTNSVKMNKFDPYLGVGGGYTWLDNIGAGTLNGVAGLNFWISDHFGLNAQAAYKHAFKDYGIKHYQYSAGIVFRFGGIDSDNDGIFDNEDNCPEEFGLIQFNGCPDSDMDGVEESLDECPLEAGPAELNGCPDDDNDGVANKNDECPNLPGTKQTLGCPDKDGDIVPDKYDKCPEVPGSMKNFGCPWQDTDKDGVLDKDDKCPNQIGPVDNNGCPYPRLSLEQKKTIDAYAETILFDLGKSDLKPEVKSTLDEVVKIIKQYPTERFHIAGHTDNSFTEEYNLNLSLDRANAVKNYLVSKGIETSRLTTQGYGEDKPIFDNKTEEGRSKNRRVEIILVK